MDRVTIWVTFVAIILTTKDSHISDILIALKAYTSENNFLWKYVNVAFEATCLGYNSWRIWGHWKSRAILCYFMKAEIHLCI